jgi:hypothetical protein
VTILDMVDSMTDIDLATVHPRAPAGPPGTEVPRYRGTGRNIPILEYRGRPSLRRPAMSPLNAGYAGASQDADPRNERSATARQTQVWLLAAVVLAGLSGVFKRD